MIEGTFSALCDDDLAVRAHSVQLMSRAAQFAHFKSKVQYYRLFENCNVFVIQFSVLYYWFTGDDFMCLEFDTQKLPSYTLAELLRHIGVRAQQLST